MRKIKILATLAVAMLICTNISYGYSVYEENNPDYPYNQMQSITPEEAMRSREEEQRQRENDKQSANDKEQNNYQADKQQGGCYIYINYLSESGHKILAQKLIEGSEGESLNLSAYKEDITTMEFVRYEPSQTMTFDKNRRGNAKLIYKKAYRNNLPSGGSNQDAASSSSQKTRTIDKPSSTQNSNYNNQGQNTSNKTKNENYDKQPQNSKSDENQQGYANDNDDNGKEVTIVTFHISEDRVYIDNDEKYIDQAPFILQNRTMVPMRAAAEALGMTVEYDSSIKQARFVDKSDNNPYILNIQKSAYYDASTGYTRYMVKNGRIFISVAYLADLLGYTRQEPDSGRDVSWYGEEGAVVITRAKSRALKKMYSSKKMQTNWFETEDYPKNIDMAIVKTSDFGVYETLFAGCENMPSVAIKMPSADTEFVLIPRYIGDEVNVYKVEFDENTRNLKREKKLASMVAKDSCSAMVLQVMIGEIVPTFEIEVKSGDKVSTTTVELSGRDGSYIVQDDFAIGYFGDNNTI